jgi:hypothetical protein
MASGTLEGFGAVVDARRKRLLAAGPHLAAPSPAQRPVRSSTVRASATSAADTRTG